LNAFKEGVEIGGKSRWEEITVSDLRFAPCCGNGACASSGECVYTDDASRFFSTIREKDALVVAAPVYFYGFPGPLKSLMDRAQASWASGPMPAGLPRPGLALLAGATGGRLLFDGMLRTLRYFFAAVGFTLEGGVLCRRVDGSGEIRRVSDILASARNLGEELANMPVRPSSGPEFGYRCFEGIAGGNRR